MVFDRKRFKEYLIGKYYIITGENSDLWKIMPLLYAQGFNLYYRDNLILIDLTAVEE